MKVYLDDCRNPPIGWTLTTNVDDTIKLLQTGKVIEISLDHDLGEVTETGYDVLKWIEREVFTKGFESPQIHIHTSNPSAKIKMELARRSIYEKSKKY